MKSENFDLVILNLAPLIFQFRIISTGKLFYLKDDDVRSQFEERLMCSYYDFLPRLREFNREYFMSLKEKYLIDTFLENKPATRALANRLSYLEKPKLAGSM